MAKLAEDKVSSRAIMPTVITAMMIPRRNTMVERIARQRAGVFLDLHI